MNDFFDQQGDKLAYILRTGKMKQKPQGFAVGGIVGGAIDDQGNSIGNIVRGLWGGNDTPTDDSGDSSVLSKAVSGLGTGKNAKDYSPLGHNWANSAPFVAQHFTALGNFFKGAEPSIRNQEIERPVHGPAPKPAETPSDWYAKWYENARRLAEAEEVVNRGQVTTRST